MKKLNYEEGKEEQLETKRRTLTRDVNGLRDKMETLEARLVELRHIVKICNFIATTLFLSGFLQKNCLAKTNPSEKLNFVL